MLNYFSKGAKNVVKKLNSLIIGRNKQERVKSSQAPNIHNRPLIKIFFGEAELNNDDGTFTGTFYDYEGNKLTSASTAFYQQTIIGNAEIGSTFGAIKFDGDWYHITGGSSNIRNAYVIGDASGSTIQTCCLDIDNPSAAEQISVRCTICGGSALDEALPRLDDGDLIPVYYDGSYWRSCTVFQSSEDCT